MVVAIPVTGLGLGLGPWLPPPAVRISDKISDYAVLAVWERCNGGAYDTSVCGWDELLLTMLDPPSLPSSLSSFLPSSSLPSYLPSFLSSSLPFFFLLSFGHSEVPVDVFVA